jgi:hypothetical protein
MTRMRLTLHWQSGVGRHTDCSVATKLEPGGYIFPPELEAQLMDKGVGHSASHAFGPGELLPTWMEKALFRVRDSQFDRHFTRRGFVEPRNGRFYPRG